MLELFVIFEILTIISIWILVRLYADLKIEHNEELERYKKVLAIDEDHVDKLEQLNKDILTDWKHSLDLNTELIERCKFLTNILSEKTDSSIRRRNE